VTQDAKGNTYDADPGYVITRTKSLLSSISMWTAPLNIAQQQDLHTCLTTRLNPSAKEVDIWLGGASVTNDGVTAFPIEEALWATIEKTDRDGKIVIAHYVWPSKTVRDTCGLNANDPAAAVKDAVNTRVCGTPLGGCGLDIQTTTCTPDLSGHYACPVSGSNVPAIQTTLQCDAWCSLYPGCPLPLPFCSGFVCPP